MRKYETIEEASRAINYLEEHIINPIIGEVFCSEALLGRYLLINPANEYRNNKFKQFKKNDVSDTVSDNIKIFDVWFKKSDVIYYDSLYETKRKKIRKNYKKVD